MNKNEIILKTEKIRKEFPGIVALDNVDFELRYGEVHAICGENGAGKSTFCNVVTGILKPDSGKIFFENNEILFNGPGEALAIGIRMLYQERNLIHYLTGAQNILLREEPLKAGFFVDEKDIIRRAEEIKKLYKMDVPLNCQVSKLSSAKKQAIEILRALLYKPKVLILDEPTASLTEKESTILFEDIKRIKSEGVSVVLITHKLEEVFENADTVTIFRNGKKIETSKKDDITKDECVRLMINRKITSMYPTINYSGSKVIMEVSGVSDYSLVKDNSFKLRRGEVLGFYGLIGAGKTELVELIYGLRKLKDGIVKVNGEEIEPRVSKMIARKVFLIPDDRREKGLINAFNLKKNITVTFMDVFSKILGIINHKKENQIAEKIVSDNVLKIKYVSLNQDIETLSGGNKQKVIISRWISKENINVLILDEPTTGIDVGTKFEIYKMIRELAEKRNIAIIFVSSELNELTGVCDRICIFKEGVIQKELERDEFNYEKILALAM